MGERNFIDLDGSPSSAPLSAGDACGAGVGDFCSTLERAVKTVCLYPATNPLPDEFRQKLFDTLTRRLDSDGRFVLVTTDTSFLYECTTVFERPGTDENLAYLLFRDGIRELAFEPGVQRDECDRFLTALVGVFSAAGTATDVANRLWEAALPHIRHYTIDRIVSGTYTEMADDEQLALRHRQFVRDSRLGQDLSETPSPPGEDAGAPYAGTQQERFRYVMEVFGNAGQLSDDEQAQIASLAGAESPRVGEQLGLDVLFEITRCSHSPLLVEEALAVTEKQYDRCVQSDAWDLARLILQGWRSSPPDATVNVTQRLQQALSYAAEPRHFERLTKYLNANPEADLGDARAFLELFGSPALKPITAMLCSLKHRPTRKMVCSYLSAHGGDGVDLIGGFVYDKRWYVVRNVAMVLGEIGQDRAISYLRKSAGHQDRRVRLETLRALQRIGGLEAARVLLTFVNDPDVDLRKRALRAIRSEHSAVSLVELKRRVEDSSLAEHDHDEIREILMAFARAGGPAATPHLMRLAKRSTWFARRWFPVKVAAIEALGLCRAADVRVELEVLGRDRNREIAQAARTALSRRSHSPEDHVTEDFDSDEEAG
jgi:HEAT repeat protein